MSIPSGAWGFTKNLINLGDHLRAFDRRLTETESAVAQLERQIAVQTYQIKTLPTLFENAVLRFNQK